MFFIYIYGSDNSRWFYIFQYFSESLPIFPFHISFRSLSPLPSPPASGLPVLGWSTVYGWSIGTI